MSMLNKKENIPTVGDMVEKVQLNKDKSLVQITFSNKKFIVFHLAKDNINQDDSEDSLEAKIKTEPKVVPKTMKIVTSKKVNEMIKNSPEDQEYQDKAMQTLARLEGKSPEEIKEMMAGRSATKQVIVDGGAISADWKEKAAAILEKSEEKSKKLTEMIARKSGAKLEGDFAGKSTISLG